MAGFLIITCSPLRGRFKGTDRAVYTVEPCGQGNIYILPCGWGNIYIALWSITEEMFFKEIAFLRSSGQLVQ